MSTCIPTPRKPKLYVTMADASSTFPALSEASRFRRKKISMRNKLNDVQAFPDRIKSVLRTC